MKYLKLTATALFIVIIAIFVSAPTKYMQSFFDGITVWAYNVLPAIFPFTVITSIALQLQSKRKRSLTKLLYNIDCDDALIASVLCGYPIGAKAISDSNADAETATKMCAFCSSAGPIFMLATVGAKLLQNTAATVIVITVNICSAIINGFIYRKSKSKVANIESNTVKQSNFGEIITNSALSVISVGGLIALFYMFTDMIKTLLPGTLADNLAIGFAIGFLEMTNGIFNVCRVANTATATVLCSALLAFGGVCVLLQCYAFVSGKGVKPISMIKMKLTQASIATILSYILVKIFL